MMLPRSTIPDTAAGYEVRERGASPGLIVQADVDVPHRHADVVVAGQFTGCDEEVTAAQQLGDLSLPPCHVYTGSCCFGLVGDARPRPCLRINKFAATSDRSSIWCSENHGRGSRATGFDQTPHTRSPWPDQSGRP